MSALLVVIAAALSAVSGLPPLLARKHSRRADLFSAALLVTGSLVGLAAVGTAVAGVGGPPLRLEWHLPGALLEIAVDGLSALFLLPLFVISGLGAVYATSYWPPLRHPRTAPLLRLFYGVTTAAIAIVFVARNSILFLMAWEVMALGAFLMVLTEGRRRDVRQAGWIYITATHTGTLALFALFAIVASLNEGSFHLGLLRAGLASSPAGMAVFWLALFGFGLKAGIMPMHIWLPGAHAATPSHVSALMSGVLIKTGIYGLVRILSLFPDPPLLWGGVLLAFGAISGVLGVAYALGQHDLKRLLAYHSIENIGIITMGLGLWLGGRSLGEPVWAVLGLAGGLLHVVNHAFFKALLFLGAGSVIHATGTREMDRMGGLLGRLPRTSSTFLVGAVAICGLPPLNGFVSEFLIYLGLLRPATSPGPVAIGAAGAAAALALIGGLALSCFVKAFGTVFLGTPRDPATFRAHEASAMTLPLLILSGLCVFVGLFPFATAPLLNRACLGAGLPADVSRAAPLATLSLVQIAIAAVLLGVSWLLARRLRDDVARSQPLPTWDCGYAAGTSRMQYTSSSFASWSVDLFRWALQPREEKPRFPHPFPAKGHYESHVPDAVLDRILIPAFRRGGWLLSRARVIQRGQMQLYLLYVVIILLVLLWRV